MTSRTIPSDFVKSVLHNGVGRYFCNLQRLTLKFCKSTGSSKGMREFIEHNLVDFARDNPGVIVYLKPRRHRAPVLDAEYVNGEVDYQNCHDFTREEIAKYVEFFKNKSRPAIRLRKFWHTDNPSIQGIWTPFTNINPDINIRTFPDSDAFRAEDKELSATEVLRNLAKNAQNFPLGHETQSADEK